MTTPEHILIVDDDAEIRSLLSNYLQKNGYRTTAVAEGKGMLAALDKGRADLIVLDLMLPGDDGLVLCRNLRARSDIPVVMLTARGEDMDRISVWKWVLMITCPSHSIRVNCWRASRAFCAGQRLCQGTWKPEMRPESALPDGNWTRSRANWSRRKEWWFR
jgi:CheY-like chemotaxis protein